MIDYSLPYHLIEEVDGDYKFRLSFQSYEDALDFIKFAPGSFLVVASDELEEYIYIE
ncbi:hypothetical protein ACFLS9_06920 [Bacteroidota bacterium]